MVSPGCRVHSAGREPDFLVAADDGQKIALALGLVAQLDVPVDETCVDDAGLARCQGRRAGTGNGGPVVTARMTPVVTARMISVRAGPILIAPSRITTYSSDCACCSTSSQTLFETRVHAHPFEMTARCLEVYTHQEVPRE
jgi:hypothetical protein